MFVSSRRLLAVATSTFLVVAACSGDAESPTASNSDVAEEAASEDLAPDTEPSPTEPAAAEPEVTEPAATEPAAEDVGARCGDEADDATFTDTPCDVAHSAEFAGIVASPAEADTAVEPKDDPAFHRACLEVVTALIGNDPGATFLDARFVVEDDRTECWVTSGDGFLTGSLAEVGVTAALGDRIFIESVDVGSCYRFAAPDIFSFVEITDCSAAITDDEVYQSLGTAVLSDQEIPYDEDDADRALTACDEVIGSAAFDVAVAPTFFVLTPSEIGYDVYSQRSVSCVGEGLGEVLEELGDSAQASSELRVGDCASSIEEDFALVPCDEPHVAEFAGFADVPFDVLPDDAEVAGLALRRACAPVVEALTERSLTKPGSAVSFSADAGLGQPVDVVECYLEAGDGLLVGSINEIGFDAALGANVVLADLEPGACFRFAADSFAYGSVVDCADPGAFVAIGEFVAEGPAEWPGDDALRAQRQAACAEVLAASGVSADPDGISGTFPSEDSWEAFERRVVTCDSTPL